MADTPKQIIVLSLDSKTPLGQVLVARVKHEWTMDNVILDLIHKGLEAERGILPPRKP